MEPGAKEAAPPPSVEELSNSACWALLRDVPIGRISLQGISDIEVFPVNFVVDGGTIVFHTASGTKLTLIGDGARCTFEADEVDRTRRLVWSVVLKGSAQPIQHRDAIVAILDLEVPAWQAGAKPTYVRIEPDLISGRRFPVPTS